MRFCSLYVQLTGAATGSHVLGASAMENNEALLQSLQVYVQNRGEDMLIIPSKDPALPSSSEGKKTWQSNRSGSLRAAFVTVIMALA